MEIKKKVISEYVFSSKEATELLRLLKYCKHRWNEHKPCGIHKVIKDEYFLNYFIEKLVVTRYPDGANRLEVY